MNNADQPSYPIPIAQGEHGLVMDTTEYSAINGGLTKRESFAKQAMPAIQTACIDVKPDFICGVIGVKDGEYDHLIHYPKYVAKLAVIQADALLDELSNE